MPVVAERLAEPTDFQLGRIDREALAKDPRAVDFAYGLSVLESSEVPPNPDFTIDPDKISYHKTEYGDGAVLEIKPDPETSGMGLVVLSEIELKRGRNGNGDARYTRLEGDLEGGPKFLQMGPHAMEVALASRAAEFEDMHSDEMYAHVSGLLSGQIPHVPRSSVRSEVLENALEMEVRTNGSEERGWHEVVSPAERVITTKELAYKRQFAGDRVLSRNQAAKGTLILGPDGAVSSIYALGGMPPVSGSVDAVVTAALSYMRSWIPRNGVFAGNFERQLAVFEEAKRKIQSLGLPDEIEENAISLIGIAVGCDNPTRIADDVERFKDAGGHAARIYTTNPDRRVIDTAQAIYGRVGDDFLTAVGPIVDKEQADILHDKGHVREFLSGHGGGENCTSLSGGGAANSIELLYLMSLDPRFIDSLIGLEGGTGDNIGPILPMVDVISMNKRGAGGIESTGGLYAVREGRPVLPYHGSASAVTKLIEYYMRRERDPQAASRIVGPDGRVRNVEGKPNYMEMRDSARSNVVRYREARELAGRVLADQGSMSIYELREKIAREGGYTHVRPSRFAVEIADPHRVSAS